MYAQMVAGCGRAALVLIVRRKVAPASAVDSNCWAGYDAVSVEGYRHERVDHGEELVADGGRHINGIENFWSQAKRHLRRFDRVPKGSFPLFLQECMWRFNGGTPRELPEPTHKLLCRPMLSSDSPF